MKFKTIHILSFALISMMLLSSCAEVELASHAAKKVRPAQQGTFKVGTPYKIDGKWYNPFETYDMTETGIASWYGPQFHGKHTANGETYNMYELTAAHRTLQLPSLVRVTNLENGKSVIVRVNDRGPFSKGRVIDLSMKAAELLGFKNKGTAKVRLQVLTNESMKIAEIAKSGRSTKGYEVAMNQQRSPVPTPQAPQPSVMTNAASSPVPSVELADIGNPAVQGHVRQGKFYPDPVVHQLPVQPTNIYVQVAAFTRPENAQAYVARMTQYGPVKIQEALVNGAQFYRVRIGPIPQVEQADQLLFTLGRDGYTNAITVVD